MRARPSKQQDTRPVQPQTSLPQGGFVELDGELHYRITHYDRMEPFLISVPSDSDLWMFIASGGGLTAGRVDPDGSLFPYRTVDQLHESHHHTGPITVIRVEQPDGSTLLWEPFADAIGEEDHIERSLLKNQVGNRLVFQETRHDLSLVFRYCWSASDTFGWVRRCTLENLDSQAREVDVLDGMRNILPHGAPLSLYQQSSNLVNAYKKSEIDPDTGLGIFSLTAGITDRAEAVEVLKANTVWCAGLLDFRVHLRHQAVQDFRRGKVMAEDQLLNGAPGNYLISTRLTLDSGSKNSWSLVGDTGLDHGAITALLQHLTVEDHPEHALERSLVAATENLRQLVASADGLQRSQRPETCTHHFANVLFNSMRGGVFSDNYQLPLSDFLDFLQVRNRRVFETHQALLTGLDPEISLQQLKDVAQTTADSQLERLVLEYLPLHFGRRHGDPSRPWNRFSIHVRDTEGNQALHYEGNWRDIFQNWEALSLSFPDFLPNLVAKFLNASTVDGYNPYRLNRDGLEWETVTPEDPWSNIGYWGDHQIIYLLKLLEAWNDHQPGSMEAAFDQEVYSYAQVPYRLKPYAEILKDASDTIEYDHKLADEIERCVVDFGTDGKLLTGLDDEVHHANLFEKLLVPALSKLSNFVPDAGIWMNTQRPEWNDANNALAGGGVSVVTLFHLRRYLVFMADRLESVRHRSLPVAIEIHDWFHSLGMAFDSVSQQETQDGWSPRQRKGLLDQLGQAFESYRTQVYAHGFSEPKPLPVTQVLDLMQTALALIDRGLKSNRRRDGLFHTYNLLETTDDGSGLEIKRLQKMLEGQVAALSSGLLKPDESLEVLEMLFASDLYRSDQRSFLLYPERTLPGFLDRNRIPERMVQDNPFLLGLLKQGDLSLISRDASGQCRFSASIEQVQDLQQTLDRFEQKTDSPSPSQEERQSVEDVFESVFAHKSYTGRSGTMYGYEGLGCIYWHMVAKLLLAVQETYEKAHSENADSLTLTQLKRMYFKVRAGIGYEKTVAEYGAFPTDPYSHTSPSGLAKQPGMTGQVKEEILTRRGEMGLRVEEGAIVFRPEMLKEQEFLQESAVFRTVDVRGETVNIPLPAQSLAFTLCQVPVVYELCDQEDCIHLSLHDGPERIISGHRLDAHLGKEIFSRSGMIDLIRVAITRPRS